MTLMRWEPMREIDAVRREMDRLFGDFSSTTHSNAIGQDCMTPAIEITETDDDIVLKLEVPGIASEDLEIQATADAVTIKGERKAVEQSEGYSRSEFRYGAFTRVVSMPVQVQNTKASANHQDGVLVLTLPKAEAEKTKVVKVAVSAKA